MQIVDSADHVAAPPIDMTFCAVLIRCRDYSIGLDDWNRGIRFCVRNYGRAGRFIYLSDGSARLSGLALGDVLLTPDEISHALDQGFEIRSTDFECEIPATDLRWALLPPDGPPIFPE